MIWSTFGRRWAALPYAIFDRNPLVQSGGIQFPATQVPSADANTLDDYEEGTFTPAMTFAVPGDLSVVYTTQEGTYIKVGKLVFCRLRLICTPTHTTASGNFAITGLPFTSTNTPAFSTGGGIPSNLNAAFTWPAGVTQVALSASSNATQVILQGTGSGIAVANFTNANVASAVALTVVGAVIYEAAA
jgi:hypothetical protein